MFRRAETSEKRETRTYKLTLLQLYMSIKKRKCCSWHQRNFSCSFAAKICWILFNTHDEGKYSDFIRMQYKSTSPRGTSGYFLFLTQVAHRRLWDHFEQNSPSTWTIIFGIFQIKYTVPSGGFNDNFCGSYHLEISDYRVSIFFDNRACESRFLYM